MINVHSAASVVNPGLAPCGGLILLGISVMFLAAVVICFVAVVTTVDGVHGSVLVAAAMTFTVLCTVAGVAGVHKINDSVSAYSASVQSWLDDEYSIEATDAEVTTLVQGGTTDVERGGAEIQVRLDPIDNSDIRLVDADGKPLATSE